MTRGYASSHYFGREGMVGHQSAPAYSFLYETSTTRNPKWWPGDRVVLPDGRKFRYALATNIVANIRQGLKFWQRQSDGVSYKAATASAIGDTDITIDAGDSGDYTEDQLRGGFLVVHTHSDKKHQFLGIIGNTASDADGNITIYLEGPLTHTITTSHGVEVWVNPWTSVQQANSTSGKPGNRYTSVAGVPLVHTTVANQYLWLQTAGPCWCNPHGTTSYASVVDEREVVFDWEGSVCPQADANGANDAAQRAGYFIDRAAADAGGGMFMMQLE